MRKARIAIVTVASGAGPDAAIADIKATKRGWAWLAVFMFVAVLWL
jgi:hypothetical protein